MEYLRAIVAFNCAWKFCGSHLLVVAGSPPPVMSSFVIVGCVGVSMAAISVGPDTRMFLTGGQVFVFDVVGRLGVKSATWRRISRETRRLRCRPRFQKGWRHFLPVAFYWMQGSDERSLSFSWINKHVEILRVIAAAFDTSHWLRWRQFVRVFHRMWRCCCMSMTTSDVLIVIAFPLTVRWISTFVGGGSVYHGVAGIERSSSASVGRIRGGSRSHVVIMSKSQHSFTGVNRKSESVAWRAIQRRHISRIYPITASYVWICTKKKLWWLKMWSITDNGYYPAVCSKLC